MTTHLMHTHTAKLKKLHPQNLNFKAAADTCSSYAENETDEENYESLLLLLTPVYGTLYITTRT